MTASWSTTGTWFGPPDRPLLGWFTQPAAGRARRGVLILPPLGYEYMTTHRTLRTIAERVATSGCSALRIDYDGTGDSAGDQWDPGRVAAWRQSVRDGVEELHRLGCDDVCVVGLRFGATLALLEAASAGVSRVVAWAPVVSGRRYVRELRVLSISAEPSPAQPELEGTLSLGGFVFTAATLSDLATLNLDQLDVRPAAEVLVIERPDGSSLTDFVEHVAGLGAHVDVRAIDGTQCCLDRNAESATVPGAIVDAIVDWVGEGHGNNTLTARAGEVPHASADFDHEGAVVTESVGGFGPRGLVGIVGRPAGAGTARVTVVFANSGSEPHIGPGRAWVEYARQLNRAGCCTIRVDCRGWGESPDDDLAPARPYDTHMIADLRELIEWLGADGWGPVVLVGQCASAWAALELARQTTLDGLIACNPQLYRTPDDPVDVNMRETRELRAAKRERIKRLDRYGWWSLLDRFGVRDEAMRCLHDVSEHRTPTLMLFGHDDDGIEYLRDRDRRALARELARGWIRVIEMPGIDHGMQRAWQRDEVSRALLVFLSAFAPNEQSVPR